MTNPRRYLFKNHFPLPIKEKCNPNSLRRSKFDNENNYLTGTHVQKILEATVTPRMHKRSEFGVASGLVDEPKAVMAMSKVAKWATMAAEKQASTIYPTSKTHTQNSTIVTESTLRTSSPRDTSIINKPILRLTTTPKQARPLATPVLREEPVTPTRKQQQTTSRMPAKLRQTGHCENTAHLFNNAGLLIPSIPGVDPVTERLFDQGKIMSLEPSRSQDGYYPDGKPRGGSFLLVHSSKKKRKRDDMN